MSTTYKQILRAKLEFESSLASARDLRDQWLSTAMDGDGFAKLSKKELDQSTKALKNKLLAVKWDFEDLEELLGLYKFDNNTQPANTLSDGDETSVVEEIRKSIGNWQMEITQMMTQLEDAESSSKLFNKHGITFHNPVSAIGSVTGNKYERLASANQQQQQQQSNETDDVVQFDKSLVTPRETSNIVTNMLYDHLEDQHRTHQQQQLLFENRNSFSDPSQVFNNLSRPATTNVYMNPNENEMILDMLETEYYNPPDGLLHHNSAGASNTTRTIDTIKKLFDTGRNKNLGTIVLILCSFPTLLILFMFA